MVQDMAEALQGGWKHPHPPTICRAWQSQLPFTTSWHMSRAHQCFYRMGRCPGPKCANSSCSFLNTRCDLSAFCKAQSKNFPSRRKNRFGLSQSGIWRCGWQLTTHVLHEMVLRAPSSSLKSMTGKVAEEEGSHQEEDKSRPRPGEDWKSSGGSQQNSVLPSLLCMHDKKKEFRIKLPAKIIKS